VRRQRRDDRSGGQPSNAYDCTWDRWRVRRRRPLPRFQPQSRWRRRVRELANQDTAGLIRRR
jgi:hypothetical protein